MPKIKLNLNTITFIGYNLIYTFYMLGILPRSLNLLSLLLFSAVVLVSTIQKRSFKFFKEFVLVLIPITFMVLITLAKQIYYFDYNLGQTVGILYVILPIVDAFCIINVTSREDLMDYIYIIFFRMILLFVLQNLANFNIQTIMSINWFDSDSSVFESSMAHDFLFITIIFKYLKKQKWAILSTVLCILCFKRLSFILCIFVLFFYDYIPSTKACNVKLLWLSKIFFIIAPLILIYLVSDDGQALFYQIFNMDLNVFTTGRVYYINLVKDNLPYINGYGATNNYLANLYKDQYVQDIHCDLLRLTWECSIVSVILYTNNMFEIIKKHYVLYFMMMYCFVEMFVSHFIEGMSIWLIFYLFIYMVNYDFSKGE